MRLLRTRADQKVFTKMDISLNTRKVKDTEDIPLVADNSVIKALGYFKLCKYGKEFFNNLAAATYGHMCRESAK